MSTGTFFLAIFVKYVSSWAFLREEYNYVHSYIIQIYSGITRGRVLNGELL